LPSRLVPERIARRYFVVPLRVDNRTLTYATSQPFNAEAERDVAFACGRRTRIVAATRSAVLNALDRCYPKLRELDVLATRLRSEHPVVESLDQGDGTKSDSVVMDLCNHLIGRAVEVGASDVEVESEADRALAEDADGAQSAGRIRSRVLIADDEPITRMLVKLLLERENFDVLEASNGRQAVDIATRERPDLMVIDLNMPEMDGYEAITSLRRDITMATLPIMVLTSAEGPAVERRVLELGADDYIIKPFDPTVLLSRVNAVFRRLKVMAA
jgi:CheY-like chemotaxis protein